MKINIGLLLSVSAYIVSAAAAHYGDWVLSCIGPTLALLAGYHMKYQTTFTITGEDSPHDQP